MADAGTATGQNRACAPASAPGFTPAAILENISLAPFTTLRIGGPARFLARVTSEPELLQALAFARARHLPVYPLGGGSNLLIPDRGFPGLVLHMALAGPIHIDGLSDVQPLRRTVTYDVPAGFDWNRFVRITCDAGLTGIECLAGIPGTVGASPIQNIGAYGQEVAQTVSSVRVLDLSSLTFRDLPASACGFAYRTSIFNSTQRERFLITRVRFTFSLDATPRLTYADLQRHFASRPKPTPLQIYRAVRRIRRAKGMLLLPTDAQDPQPSDFRSAGSFFKNPIVPASTLSHLAQVVALPESQIPHWPAPGSPQPALKLPAAWLIERAGLPKGFALGPAAISTRHTLALTNRTGTATCADLLRLRDYIIAQVQSRFHLTLEQEPVLLT